LFASKYAYLSIKSRADALANLPTRARWRRASGMRPPWQTSGPINASALRQYN
jgi:hypothetical protein